MALCIARSLKTLCLSTTSGLGPGKLSSFWGSMVFCHALIPWKKSCKNNKTTAKACRSLALKTFKNKLLNLKLLLLEKLLKIKCTGCPKSRCTVISKGFVGPVFFDGSVNEENYWDMLCEVVVLKI